MTMRISFCSLRRTWLFGAAVLALLSQHGAARADADGDNIPSELCATFDVASEMFTTRLSDPKGVSQALALWRGESSAGIPVGKLICEGADYNQPWQFHLDPASVRFASGTVEVCDARPSYVNEHCSSFPNATYCPWAAKLIALCDCSPGVSDGTACVSIPTPSTP